MSCPTLHVYLRSTVFSLDDDSFAINMWMSPGPLMVSLGLNDVTTEWVNDFFAAYCIEHLEGGQFTCIKRSHSPLGCVNGCRFRDTRCQKLLYQRGWGGRWESNCFGGQMQGLKGWSEWVLTEALKDWKAQASLHGTWHGCMAGCMPGCVAGWKVDTRKGKRAKVNYFGFLVRGPSVVY